MLRNLWLIHPDPARQDSLFRRFEGLPNARVLAPQFEDLPPQDAFVTAGNSYGLMTAGIDAAVARFFGDDLVERVQFRIMNEYWGELPIGSAFVEPTGNPERPHLVYAPTMRTPCSIQGADKVYAATWAALLAVARHNLTASIGSSSLSAKKPSLMTMDEKLLINQFVY